jgi:hypothetical protein
MKRIIFIIILFFVTFYLYCNDNHSEENEDSDSQLICFLLLQPEVVFPKQIMGNVNIAFAFFGKTDGLALFMLHGPILGFQTNFIPQDYIYGIKLGYFFDLIGYLGSTLRINSFMYVNNVNQLDIRIQPEIGFIICGGLGVTYGYNFALLETTNKEIGNHRVTLFYRIYLLHYYGSDKKWYLGP